MARPCGAERQGLLGLTCTDQFWPQPPEAPGMDGLTPLVRDMSMNQGSKKRPGPTGTILGWALLRKRPLATWHQSLGNPACLLACLLACSPVLAQARHSPTGHPSWSQPQPAGGPSSPICCQPPVQLAIRSWNEGLLVLVSWLPGC